MLMNKSFFIFLTFIFLACSSTQENRDTEKYYEKEAFITDQIFHNFEHALGLSPIERFLTQPIGERGQIFEAYGYRIYLPWKLETETIRNEYTSIVLSTGNFLLAFDNPDNSTHSDLYIDMIDDFEEKPQFRSLYKDYVKSKSNYGLVTGAFNVTNDTISIDDNLNKKVIAWRLLMLKDLYLHEKEEIGIKSTPFYHFETDKIKGYQIGDTISGNCAQLSLFPSDNEELYMFIGTRGNFNATQSDIEYIIQNIEKID